ncbi:MAG: heavy metal translocating P-type ATPase, partial [Eggerthellaceae bacterium]|nr:heavy metal translocating P-type ATPase [Eggerthellaceae bacterium]
EHCETKTCSSCHSCGNELEESETPSYGAIIASALLYVAAFISELLGADSIISTSLFLFAYVVAGGKVLMSAARNIVQGKIFDEQFLMALATIGAIAVQQYPEAVGVMLFYRIGEYFEDKAVDRSRDQIVGAVDMRPDTVHRCIDGALLGETIDVSNNGVVTETVDVDDIEQTETVDATDVKIGDHLLVEAGERIPIDGTIISGSSQIDTSPVTGEPVPVVVSAGSPVASGCVNTSGVIVIRAEKLLSDSAVSRILESVEHAAENKPQMERFITRFARVYTPIVIAIAVATAVIPSFITGDWMRWVYTACTFLVISCPCAIVLSVPLSFFAGIGAASKRGILFKGGNVMEALENIRAVVMDKTGTITRGSFDVSAVHVQESYTENQVLGYAASLEQRSTHPIAQSIVSAARAHEIPLQRITNINEYAGRGIAGTIENEDEHHTIRCGSRAFLESEHIAVPDRSVAEDASTCVWVALDSNVAGLITIADEIKPESIDAIASLKRSSLQTVMLTGDASAVAQSVAEQTGIDHVYAHLLPEQKLVRLYETRQQFGPVLFVGDGINDAPVLAGADVGAAMASGSDAAIEAADVVLMTSSLSAIPQSLSIAHKVIGIAKQNIVFALVVKVAILIAGFVGFASMWAALFADVGVALLCILNSMRILYRADRHVGQNSVDA